MGAFVLVDPYISHQKRQKELKKKLSRNSITRIFDFAL